MTRSRWFGLTISSVLALTSLAHAEPKRGKGRERQTHVQKQAGQQQRHADKRHGQGGRSEATPAAADLNGKENVVLIVDSSWSMNDELSSTHKMRVAQDAVNDMIKGWDPGVHLGLTAYGHRERKRCDDIEAIAPVSKVDTRSFMGAVERLRPRGMTPISGALEHAARQLDSTKRKATVILVSDGKQNCPGDPCAAAKKLEAQGIDFTAHVVGFGLKEKEGEEQLACIAKSTGGKYATAGDAASLRKAIGGMVEEVKKARPSVKVAPATLIGTHVDFAVHCCSAPPSSQNLINQPLSALITPETEFPKIGATNRPGWNVADADVDIKSASIDLVYRQNIDIPKQAFNGYSFAFSREDGAPVSVRNATLAPDTSPELQTTTRVTFERNSVFVDVGGAPARVGSKISVRLEL